jgi:RHS repeat-associated protein
MANGANRIFRLGYDAVGNLAVLQFPNDESMRWEFTPAGRLRYRRDRCGALRYRYDAAGFPLERADESGGVLNCEYDNSGRLTKVINGNGESCRWHYDLSGRLVKEVGFDGRVQQYSYNAAGHLECYYDGKQAVIQFQRDPVGRVLQKWTADEEIIRYRYDAMGRLTSVVAPRSEIQFAYDNSGNLLAEEQNGKRLRHRYELTGKRSETRLPGDDCLHYEYDALGRFKRVSYNGMLATAVTRNARGLPIARTAGATSSFCDYDAVGRMIYQRVTCGDEVVLEQNYKYQSEDMILQIEDADNGVSVLQYDSAGRIVGIDGFVSERFAYDGAGNLLDAQNRPASGYVEGNRLKGFQNYHFEYDGVGNVIMQRNGEEEIRFHYNGQNQLIKVEREGHIIEYFYDPLGRRIKKKDAKGETFYLWDGDRLIQEQRGGEKVIFVYEPDSNTLLCLVRNGKAYFYHNDQMGIPRILTDENGAVVWDAQCKVFGMLWNAPVKKIDNPWRFPGYYYDRETGLHSSYCGVGLNHLAKGSRMRYYHPAIGRFIQPDVQAMQKHMNPYIADIHHFERPHAVKQRLTAHDALSLSPHTASPSIPADLKVLIDCAKLSGYAQDFDKVPRAGGALAQTDCLSHVAPDDPLGQLTGFGLFALFK